MVLPSQRTLRDYRNHIRPERGFNHAVVNKLKEDTKGFSNIERYVTILLDEMKVQEDLVWDKHSGELVGFVDLGDPSTNFATLSDVKAIATHVLVFLVKGIVNPLSSSFATFATTTASALQIFTVFWKAVSMLEKTCNLQVVACTADGASENRKFFKCTELDQMWCTEVPTFSAWKTDFLFFFPMCHTLSKHFVIVWQILDPVVEQDICGMMGFISSGLMSQLFFMKIWIVA